MILRTRDNGCFQLRDNYWGRYLAPAPDPEATAVITQEQLEGFELRDDIAKIPVDLWSRWVKLCFEMTKRSASNLEVSCRLLRSKQDSSVYRILVPEQSVSSAAVRVESFDKAVDIETGEIVEQWPPEGWQPCGSSHSHNTMDAFFSGTDDKYEKGDPGLHIVVGSIDLEKMEYKVVASVTANLRRFEFDPENVIEEGFNDEVTYAPEVLKAITYSEPVRSFTFQGSLQQHTSHYMSGSDYYDDFPMTWSDVPSNKMDKPLDPAISARIRIIANMAQDLIDECQFMHQNPDQVYDTLLNTIDDSVFLTTYL